jgi:hypothetical protein
MMPTLSTPVATGALIAEFDGKMYVSMRPATFDIERHTQDFVDRTVIVASTAVLKCDCGASTEWNPSAVPGGVTAYHYYYKGSDPVDVRYHLKIVRTATTEPICDHWLEVPLTLAVES